MCVYTRRAAVSHEGSHGLLSSGRVREFPIELQVQGLGEVLREMGSEGGWDNVDE